MKPSPRSGRQSVGWSPSRLAISVARFTGLVLTTTAIPSNKLLGYFRPSASRTILGG